MRTSPEDRGVIARLIQRLAGGTARAADRVMRSPGPDNVHDLRVATRRLRAVLKALQDELNPGLYGTLTFELKNLTRETSALRDADVRRRLLMPLVRATPGLAPDVRRDCAIILEQARSDGRRELRARMREPAWTDRLARVRTTARDPNLVASLTEPLIQMIGETVGLQLADLRRRMGRRRLDPGRLHRLRVRIRNARYAVEATLPLVRLRSAPLASTLRGLQDLLGTAHDLTEAQRLLAGGLFPEEVAATLTQSLDASAARQLRRCRRKLHTLAKDPPDEWRAWLKRTAEKGG
jgi:CHAD domain-containing protein